MNRFLTTLAALLLGIGLVVPREASAVTFSPPTFDLRARPGQVLTQKLKLRNEASRPVSVAMTSASFAAKPETEASGIPDLYPADEIRDGRGLGPWISFEHSKATLLPGERAEVSFSVSVPSEAEPGGYFGAVVMNALADEAAKEAGVTGAAAALVLLTVDGDVVEDLQLQEYAVPAVSASLPVRFEALLANKGTVHERPYGEVTIRNAFGQVTAVLAMNRAENKSILPSTSRRFSAEWKRKKTNDGASAVVRQWQNFAFGPYSAELRLRFGESDRVLTATKRFWVIPWLVMVFIAGGGFACVWGFRWLLARYRDRIIRRHERGI